MKRISLLLLAILILISSGYFVSAYMTEQKETTLLAKYAEDPERKRFVEAIKGDFDDLSKNPERGKKIAATMDIGLQWYILLEYDLAIKYWLRGLAIEPNNDIGWYNVGNAYRELRENNLAVWAYRKSMKVATQGEIDACIALGETYRYNIPSQKENEPRVYFECLKKHPNNRDIIARLAIYYRDSGDIDNAILYFDQLFSIEPSIEVSEELRNLRILKESQNSSIKN